jgi:hypothetical protein
MTAFALIAAALRGETPPWPEGALPAMIAGEAVAQGVAPLLSSAPGIGGWPEPVRRALRDALLVEAARDTLIQPELARLAGAFETAAVRVLLMKGAQLAYTHYARPWLRPRADTDLLIGEADRERASAVLVGLGYEPVTGFDGQLVTYQFQFARPAGPGVLHHVDLHWRIANPQVFASTLSFEELWAGGVAVPALAPAARGLSSVHALAIASVHRVAHHRASSRLIWLYDIHLLLQRLDATGRDELEGLAARTGLLAVCGRSIVEARALFGTPVPAGWGEALEHRGAGEASAAFLEGTRTKFDVLRSDLSALPGWRSRLRLVREHLFPPRAYMRRTAGVRHPALLPFAYLWRIVSGARKWFR